MFIFSHIRCAAICTALNTCDGFTQGNDEPCNLIDAVTVEDVSSPTDYNVEDVSSPTDYNVYKSLP